MQLTKDDVKILYQCDNCRFITEVDDFERCPECEHLHTFKKIDVIDFSKFQQVVEFYEKYQNNQTKFRKEQPELIKLFYESQVDAFNNWLFNYCFVDGLK